jgi:hypothetical protein
MNTVWHYWCGTKAHPERYVKYLLISVDSLINIGKVNPKSIYVTIEKQLLDSTYGQTVKKLEVNILPAPLYKNYSKQLAYYNLLKVNPDIDKLVQIDCDTIITDPNILDKIAKLNGCVNIDSSGHINLHHTISRRDGQKQRGNSLFSVSPHDINPPHSGNPASYASFKDLLKITYKVDLDQLLERSKQEMLPIGFCYVLSPKQLPTNFFSFLSFFNFFFEDDEMGLSFAKFYFSLEYADINSDHIDRNNEENVIFNAETTECFNRLKGIVHFPNKDDLIDQEMTERANSILEKLK